MTYLNDVRQCNKVGTAKGCIATYSLLRGGNQGMTNIKVAYALSTPFSAGVDTVCRLLIGYCGAVN